MAMLRSNSYPLRNRLLMALPPGERASIAKNLAAVDIEVNQRVLTYGSDEGYVYFPETGVLSVVVSLRHGAAIEVAAVGSEGIAGLAAAFGPSVVTYQLVGQVSGRFLRLHAAAFRAAIEESRSFRALAFRYFEVVISQISQGMACNQTHTTKQRFCRWLLTTADRANSSNFPMTQEFVAEMLGFRRQTISEVARLLQQKGIIRHTRGMILIIDAPRLEREACECYKILSRQLLNLYDRVPVCT
jgi:CRP-like cAMP-binding protein